jgi:hypothetical protein
LVLLALHGVGCVRAGIGAPEADGASGRDAVADRALTEDTGDSLDSTVTDGPRPDSCVPPAAGPSIATLTDTFDQLDSGKWLVPMKAPGCLVSADGVLHVGYPDSTGKAYCMAITRNRFDLTGQQLVLKVPATCKPQMAGVQTALYVAAGCSVNFQILQENNKLWATMILAGGDVRFAATTDPPYDSSADQWWRLRESGGTLSFESGPSGTGPWTARGSVVPPRPLTAVTVSLAAGHWKDTTACEARFDCLNLPSCK